MGEEDHGGRDVKQATKLLDLKSAKFILY